MIKVLKKKSNIQFSKHINSNEFDCKCSYKNCAYILCHPKLLEYFEKFRTSCGNKPISITSGFRCQKHNEDVGGRPNSYHTIGLALDMIPAKSMPIDEFAYRASAFFDKVITYKDKNFIHVQIKRS